MRIIHFSDIHAGGVIRSPGGLVDKRLFGMCNHLVRRMWTRRWERVGRAITRIKLLDPDVVVCTGDLTTISEPAEFEIAQNALRPLVDDIRFEFLFVPGNHDHYVKSEAARKSLESTFRFMMRNRWSLKDLPLSYDIQGCRFLMINQACPVPFYLSSGNLDADTITFLEKQFADQVEKPKILLNHFPVYDKQGKEQSFRRRCHNNDILKKAFADGTIDFSLCGHIHHPFIRKETSGVTEICAGSLTYSGMFSLVDFDPETRDYSQSWINVDIDEEAPTPPQAATAFSS